MASFGLKSLGWPCVFVCMACSAQSGPAGQPSTRVDQADARISFWQAQVARDPEYWGSLNSLSAAYAQKARETGEISYFELAEAALAKSLRAESTHAEAAPAYTQLATVHLAVHRFSDAAVDAAKAISLNPKDPSAYTYAGDAQVELGNYGEAEKFYAALVAPNDGKPHVGLQFLAYSHQAGLKWVLGRVEKADDDLRKAIALADQMHLPAENLAWTHFMSGEQLFQSGKLEAAEQEEELSLKIFPRYHRALAAMGQIRAAQRRLPEAIEFYKQAITIIPLPIYAAALGDIYSVSGDRTLAEKQYALVEFIGKLSAINKQVFNRELAIFYADHDRNLPAALLLAESELEVRHDVYTSDALAWALLKNGHLERARTEIEHALRMGTRDALMEYHAGMIYAALNERNSATSHLHRALQINPAFHVIFGPHALRTLAGLETGNTAAAPDTESADGRTR